MQTTSKTGWTVPKQGLVSCIVSKKMILKSPLIFLLPLFFFMQSCGTTPDETTKGNKETLAGSWKFIADQELDQENKVCKQDTAVSGLLIYTNDGKMSVQLLWRKTRGPLFNDSIMEQDGRSAGLGLGFNTWNLDQTRRIIDSYDAYFGIYDVDWDKKIVTHTITGNFRPERPGFSYKRAFRIKDDTLFLKSTDTTKRWQIAWLRD
jgi:hypothetical protein